MIVPVTKWFPESDPSRKMPGYKLPATDDWLPEIKFRAAVLVPPMTLSADGPLIVDAETVTPKFLFGKAIVPVGFVPM